MFWLKKEGTLMMMVQVLEVMVVVSSVVATVVFWSWSTFLTHFLSSPGDIL
jgi:hypothetical protein